MTQEGPNIPLRQLAFVAFGANLPSSWGDPVTSIGVAQGRLAELTEAELLNSALYSSPAFPPGSGPAFINCVSAVPWSRAPDDLLSILHQIEAEAGRERVSRWSPRVLDLDLLAVSDAVRPDHATWQTWADLPLADQTRLSPPELILPHPRLQDRAFVLVPMAEIAPDWTHPILQQSVAELCAALPAQDRDAMTRLPPENQLVNEAQSP